MIETHIYQAADIPILKKKSLIIAFLHTHLEQYGDQPEDIEKAFDYAMQKGNADGGFVAVAKSEGRLVGVAIVNKTGMNGYIPENILVYIATHKEYRGKGIATALMNEVILAAEGNIALHVEHDNPAIGLYEKFGFTNKYLEMRLQKN